MVARQSLELARLRLRKQSTQAWFACRSCGVVMHADRNGSRNIAHRADAVWQRGAVNRPSRPKQAA